MVLLEEPVLYDRKRTVSESILYSITKYRFVRNRISTTHCSDNHDQEGLEGIRLQANVLNKEIMAQESRLKLDQLIYGSGTNWSEWYEKLSHLCVSAFGKAADWIKTGAHTYPLPDTVLKWTTRGLTNATANAKVIEFYTAV